MAASPAKERLLVVDDALDTREVLQRNLGSQGYQVFTASNILEAMRFLETVTVDLVITDLKMPGGSGLDLIRHVRENLANTEVMMITGYPTIEGALTASKIGAEDYLAKPFTQEELFSTVRRVLDKLRASRQVRGTEALGTSSLAIIGESESMHRALAAIRRAAGESGPVLITGESGTGKELAARAIHYRSARASAPFIVVNGCGIPAARIDSELFGSLADSFSGVPGRQGLLQLAHGGSIFFNEIQALPLGIQARLLEVIRDGDLRLGGDAPADKIDLRIFASTHRDKAGSSALGLFHQALVQQPDAIAIPLPPLRNRKDDIPLLIRHFVEKFSKELSRPIRQFSDPALAWMRSYPWPGNVRELENVIYQLVDLAEVETIGVSELSPLLGLDAIREASPRRTLADVESEYIQIVLASVGGNKSRAAEILGIDRKTLRKRLPEVAGPLNRN
jgi:two-component system, NtrC family, response regulator HydG